MGAFRPEVATADAGSQARAYRDAYGAHDADEWSSAGTPWATELADRLGGKPAPHDAINSAVGHYAEDAAGVEDPAAVRRELIDELIDIGFEGALGDGAPKQTNALREQIPAELVQRMVASGNDDLLALFVGVAGWGVEGLDQDALADPAGHGWEQQRSGKSLTDHTRGGFGIAHYDTQTLKQIVGDLRQTDVHAWAEHQGYEQRPGEKRVGDLRPPEQFDGEAEDRIVFAGVKDDPEWQAWSSTALQDRDMQRYLIEQWSGKWRAAKERADKDAVALGCDPYDLAFYYAGARNSSSRKMDRLSETMLGADLDGSQSSILGSVLKKHGETTQGENGWHVEGGGTFASPEELLRDSNGAIESHDAWRIATMERARALHAHFSSGERAPQSAASPLVFDDDELGWQRDAIDKEQASSIDVERELARQEDQIVTRESTPERAPEPQSHKPLDAAGFEAALATNVLASKQTLEAIQSGVPADEVLEKLLDARMELVERHAQTLPPDEREELERKHAPLRRRAQRKQLDELTARYAELEAQNGDGKPTAEMKALREQRRQLSNAVNGSMTEWNQYDKEWAYNPYGTSKSSDGATDMRANGCMPTSIAMTTNFHLQELPENLADGTYADVFRPYDAEFATHFDEGKPAAKQGRKHHEFEGDSKDLDPTRSGAHFVKHFGGKSTDVVSNIGEAFDSLDGQEIERANIEEQLLRGNPVVAGIGGHIVVIQGIDDDGNFIMSDPGSGKTKLSPRKVKKAQVITRR